MEDLRHVDPYLSSRQIGVVPANGESMPGNAGAGGAGQEQRHVRDVVRFDHATQRGRCDKLLHCLLKRNAARLGSSRHDAIHSLALHDAWMDRIDAMLEGPGSGASDVVSPITPTLRRRTEPAAGKPAGWRWRTNGSHWPFCVPGSTVARHPKRIFVSKRYTSFRDSLGAMLTRPSVDGAVHPKPTLRPTPGRSAPGIDRCQSARVRGS